MIFNNLDIVGCAGVKISTFLFCLIFNQLNSFSTSPTWTRYMYNRKLGLKSKCSKPILFIYMYVMLKFFNRRLLSCKTFKISPSPTQQKILRWFNQRTLLYLLHSCVLNSFPRNHTRGSQNCQGCKENWVL